MTVLLAQDKRTSDNKKNAFCYERGIKLYRLYGKKAVQNLMENR